MLLQYHLFQLLIVQFQKISILPHRRDWNFLGDGGSVRPKNLKKCMNINWNFQRGGEGGVGLRKNPFCEGGMVVMSILYWMHSDNILNKKYPSILMS